MFQCKLEFTIQNNFNFNYYFCAMTKEEKLQSIVDYIEYANLQFVEPFSLISATVVEASYWTEIPKNVVLVHINRYFKKKYGEKYIKAQFIAHKIASGENPNEENDNTPKKGKGREVRTEFGMKYQEYTGLNTKDNHGLYMACRTYYEYHKELPWKNKAKWKNICEKYDFVDRRSEE